MGSDFEQDLDISASVRSFIPQIFSEGLLSVRPGSRPY